MTIQWSSPDLPYFAHKKLSSKIKKNPDNRGNPGALYETKYLCH